MDEVLAHFRTIIGGGMVVVCVYFATTHISTARARDILSQRYGCELPPAQPLKDPIFALDGIFDAIQAVKAHRFLQNRRQQYETYGHTFSSQLSTTRTINTIEPENFKALLSTHFRDYIVGPPRRNAFGPFIGNSVLLVDGTEWEHSRALLRPSFNRSQAGDLYTLETHVQALIDIIPKDGSTVDLQELFLRFTADVTTDFLFGESICSLSQPDAFGGDLTSAFKAAQIGGETRFRLGTLSMFAPNKPFYAALKKIHAYMDSHVKKAVKSREEQKQQQSPYEPSSLDDQKVKYIFLHELAKATSDRSTLRNELLGIFVAGRDTTSALLGNLFFVLARNPKIFEQLRGEVAKFHGKKPSLDDLKGMTYLTACINESLRLYPVVPGSSRIATRDTILPLGGGTNGQSPVLVRKGTLVIYHFFAMHLRHDIWGEDSEEFRPERWVERRPGAWEFLPFGGGPRNCIGQQFALLEASYTVVRLLQEFKRVDSRDSDPWTESMGATVNSANGVKVALLS